MAWSSIIGQQRAKRLLKNLHESGRLPHALLFIGPPGVGKDAAAIELAKMLNCESGSWEACGICKSCRQMQALRHPRLKLVFALPRGRSEDRDDTALDKLSDDDIAAINEQIDLKAENPYHRIALAKGQEIRINSIRDIRRESALRSSGHGRTVVLISEADRMNAAAANALLKTLEEPTGDMMLILTSARRDALPQTILSRCQVVRFDALSDEDIRAALERHPETDPQSIQLAVQVANGSYTDALSIATDRNPIVRSDIADYLRAVYLDDPIRISHFVDTYTKRDDRAALGLFLAAVQSWFRDVLRLQEGMTEGLRNGDLLEPIQKFAAHFPAADCGRAISAIDDIIDLIPKNVHLSTAMIVLSHRLRRCILSANGG